MRCHVRGRCTGGCEGRRACHRNAQLVAGEGRGTLHWEAVVSASSVLVTGCHIAGEGMDRYKWYLQIGRERCLLGEISWHRS